MNEYQAWHEKKVQAFPFLNFVGIKLLEIGADKVVFSFPNIYCKGCKSRILEFFCTVGDALRPKIKEKRPKG
jgi:hypothetical protein